MQRTCSAVALVREFVEDTGSKPSRKPIGSLGVLEPEQALAACQGALMAWAVTTLPGTKLRLVGGHLRVAR